MASSSIPEMTPEQKERYWAKVDKHGPDECWPWTGAKSKAGYGRFKVGNSIQSPHRIAVALDGRDPAGLCALHSCDFPPCCNPAHLRIGNHADNNLDALVRGRHASASNPGYALRGSDIKQSRLTPEQVQEIRADKRSLVKIARAYGVGETAIFQIKARSTWKHIFDPSDVLAIEMHSELVETLTNLEAYLRNTPHRNALEAAAARKVLARLTGAN